MNTLTDSTAAWEVLRSIPDPEFGINIVDLGLIYSVDCHAGDIDVTMTLTTPNCPSGDWIYEGVKVALASLPGVNKVNVAMVFDPRWTTNMLSESARRQLGCED
jgi:metal-sulfur cluster biosynthetic enzyme